MLSDMRHQPMSTGFIGWSWLYGWFSPSTYAHQPADWSDTEAEELAAAAAAAQESGVCTIGSPNFDADICAQIQNKDISDPQRLVAMYEEHHSRATTASERCNPLTSPLCFLGMTDQNGAWLPFGDWPMAAKIGGGIIAAVALGSAIGLVRGLTSLAGGK